MRRPIQILSVALVAAAALAAAGPAAAKTPCWQTLINDWYDGRIDSVYPVSCYREALEHMPEDVAQYYSLEDDLNRALAAAISSGGTSGGSGGGTSSSGGGGTTGNSGTTTGSAASQTSTFHGGPRAGRTLLASGGLANDSGPVGQAIGALGPDSADSVPIPLIVLGALALTLLALGSLGLVARRAQNRRTALRAGAKS